MIKQSTFIIFLAFAMSAISQESYSPKKVSKAAFFDKTPPLIEMEKQEPGLKDNSWKDGVVGNEFVDFPKDDKIITDVKSVQSSNGTKQSKGPIVSIDGVNSTGYIPPDTDGDVGPDHYFQMINVSFAIYNKSGVKLYGPVSNSTLWSGFPGPWSGTNDGDPIVLYDDVEDRWLASQFAVNTSNNKYYELIAISETGDPLGSWYRYAFEFDLFCDYPKIGIWNDSYLATFHMFGNGGFQGSSFVAFEKEKMLIGDPDAQMVYYGEFGTRWGYLPADADGESPPTNMPGYFVGINMWGNHNMEIWQMELDWDNTSNSSFTLDETLQPNSFNNNFNGITQPGTTQKLDAFENNLMFRLPYRNFGTHSSIVANHAVKVGTKIGIRWYELRKEGNDNWYIYQQGTYSPDDDNRWMGSIAIAADGTIALGYSVSSNTVFPSIRYTGRSPDAPLGEMNMTELEVATGVSSQTGNNANRWGDYAAMTVDPVNDSVFWFTTEYMPGGGWGTHIVAFDFAEILAPIAYAGVDTTICDNELFEVNAFAQYYNSVLWETSGDGSFQNATAVDTKYLRGSDDIENGSVTLTLNASGFEPGLEDSDDMILYINQEPEANAGVDQFIGGSEVANLDGDAFSYSSVEWTTDGDGSFNDPSQLSTFYTPGVNDISSGEATITLTAFPSESCEADDSDNMKVYIGTTGIDNPESAISGITIIPNPNNGKFKLHFSSVVDEKVKILIKDLTGRIIQQKSIVSKGNEITEEIDLSDNTRGVYIVEVISGNLKQSEKLIIK